MIKVKTTDFTFHNVSINTGAQRTTYTGSMCFTFHNVSINTKRGKRIYPDRGQSLHSTMFLLIRVTADSATTLLYFTFHNVSINTMP